jgi:hypothetical protein
MRSGKIGLVVLTALLLPGHGDNIDGAMETNQLPQPSPGLTDPLPKPSSPSPGPPKLKLPNQISPYTQDIVCL